MRLNILISAFYCSPYQGGEAAVGWNVVTCLAKHHNVTVIYGDLSDEQPMLHDLTRYQEKCELPNSLRFVHVPARGLTRFFHRLHVLPFFWFCYYEAYRRWQIDAFHKAKQLHKTQPFDLAHQLTIISYREPGYLWKLGIPFFWGPINGAAMIPWSFIRNMQFSGAYRHLTRNLMNWFQMHLPSRSSKAARLASKVWTVTAEDQLMVNRIWRGDADTMIETGTITSTNARVRRRAEHEPLRIIWCGFIEARKALHLLLESLAKLNHDSSWSLTVVGEGPERESMQALANQFGLQSKISWTGRVSHESVQDLMSNAHLLVHSSLKEGTPHVVLEAISNGLPVICHDCCGMGTAVTSDCGIKVPMKDPCTSIRGFTKALNEIICDPERLSVLSLGALQRAGELSWESKVKRYIQCYNDVISRNKP